MVRTIRNFSPQNGDPRRSLGFRIKGGTRVLGEINHDGFGSAAVHALVLGMVVFRKKTICCTMPCVPFIKPCSTAKL